VPVPVPQAVAAQQPHVLRNMLLFLAAPFVGLVYAVLLPFVGLGMLAWVAFKKQDKPAATPPQAD
jgi:hypothetical protein